jgi:hypothetical protein
LIGFTPHDALTVDPDAEAIVLVSREIFAAAPASFVRQRQARDH